MKRRTTLPTFLRKTAGHSVVEVVVATALVVTVLIPLSGLAIYLLTAEQNEPHLVALTIGQQAMEETLHKRDYESQTVWLQEDRWRVQKRVTQAGNQITIVIHVFRQHRPKPLVELMTVRLLR